MRCTACRHDNPQDSRFCETCGAGLYSPRTCPACNRQVSPSALYCNYCGTRQNASSSDLPAVEPQDERVREERGEYRQLTSLFCDLVGSTELAERLDPEELRDVMGEYRAICAEALKHYDGHIAQFLGDGVLVYFGYPRAHEDDAERAIRGALELQRRLGERFASRRVAARIGIHTGQVIFGDSDRETLALGSAMNLAARIESIADPGGVAISEATHRLTAGIFATRDLGPQTLKGVVDPVRVYAVDRVLGGRRRRPAAGSQLIGRDRELGLLTERFEQVEEGRGQVVLITGESGIGKSRLALALRNEIGRVPHSWIDMQCSPFTSRSALRPIIDLFQERTQSPGEESLEQRSERLAEGLAEGLGLALENVLPYLCTLLDLPQLERFPLPTLTPELQRERTMEALCAVTESLAAQQPVVIEIEDLHWADPSTLEYLGRLVELAPTTRLLLLCTARPEFELPWRRLHVAHLQLTRLSQRATIELIDAVAGERNLPEQLAQRIATRSDGVPLFVEELTRAVLDPAIVTDRSDRFEPGAGVQDYAIPMTLQGSLMARLDRLRRAKRVAQLGATLGHQFEYQLIENVGDVEVAALRASLEQLVEAEILYQHGTPPNAKYSFKHALLRDTAYRSQLRADRRETHARVVAALESHFPTRVASEPAAVAYHCVQAGLHDKAAAYYQAAGALAASHYANEEALGHLDAALAELSGMPEDTTLYERELAARLTLVSPLIAMRGFSHAEVEALHQRIAELCEQIADGPGQLPGLLGLARYHQRRGAVETAAELGESILHIATEVGIPVLEVVGRLIIGSNEITVAQSSRAIADLERALELARSIELPPATSPLEPELLSFIHAVLGVALASGGHPLKAAAQARAARERALDLAHEPTIIHVLALSTVTLYLLDDYETTIEWGREALELSAGRGFHGPEAEARTNVGWARVALGDQAGLKDVEAGLAAALHSGFRGGLCEYLQAAADANRLAGRYARAHELLDRSHAVYQETGEAICFEGRQRRMRAMTYLAEGASEEAEAELLRALEILSRYGAHLECLKVATELLRLAEGGNKTEIARNRLARLYEVFESGFEYRPLRAAKQLLDATSPKA